MTGWRSNQLSYDPSLAFRHLQRAEAYKLSDGFSRTQTTISAATIAELQLETAIVETWMVPFRCTCTLILAVGKLLYRFMELDFVQLHDDSGSPRPCIPRPRSQGFPK